MVHLITAMSHAQFARRCVADLGPCANILRFTGTRGRSRQSRAVIVSLFSVFAQLEAVYDMHFVALHAFFLHQGSWRGHRLRPLGAVFLVFDALDIRTL